MKVHELFEARKSDLPYEEKKTKGIINRVIVSLKGNESGAATRLTKRYEELDEALKDLADKRNALNSEVKELVDDLFDAEDCIYTRVVETISYTITLSKGEKAESKTPKKSIDYEGAFKALSALVPDLTEQVKLITEEFTKEIPTTDTPQKLTVKRTDEGLKDTASRLVAKFKRLLASVKKWAEGYDSKLEKVKNRFS